MTTPTLDDRALEAATKLYLALEAKGCRMPVGVKIRAIMQVAFLEFAAAPTPTFPNTGGPTEDEVARVICNARGFNPETLVEVLDESGRRFIWVPVWTRYTKEARAILKLLTEKGEKNG